MTILQKSVRREVSGAVRQSLIVSLHPDRTIGLRAKRTRHEYRIPIATIYRWAIEAELDERRRMRAQKRRLGVRRSVI